MRDNFRSIFVLKSRYGESNVEDFIYYDGKCNKWVEMPAADSIYDYSIFENPKWYLNTKDNIKMEKTIDKSTKQKSKFIL